MGQPNTDYFFVLGCGDFSLPNSDLIFNIGNPADPASTFKDLAIRISKMAKAKKVSRIVFFVTESFKDQQYKVIRKVRKLAGCRVIVSGDCLDALALLKKGEIDLIIREDSAERMFLLLQVGFKDTDHPKALWRDGRTIKQHRSPHLPGRKEKVLLVLMPAWNNFFAPAGLAHIATALKEAEYEVDVVDLNCAFWNVMKEKFVDCAEFHNIKLWSHPESFKNQVLPHMDFIYKLLDESIRDRYYSFVGFSLFITNYQACEVAFKKIRKINPNLKIVCGGPSCDEKTAENLLNRNLIDAAVLGEGEVSIVELLEMYRDRKDLAVPGVIRREKNGQIRKGPSRPLAKINDLSFPDFSEFDVYNYETLKLPVYFSRGCVARCAFCAETEYWVRFRIITVERLVDSLEKIIATYGIRDFQFTDSLMNGSHRHLEMFADEIIRRKLKISFHGYCRLDAEMTPVLLNKMARAGCSELSFGMESGSQRVLDLMRKETKVENVIPIINNAFAAGIKSTVCVIVGFPGERWVDFLKTVILLFKIRKYICTMNLSVMALAEGSKVTREMEEFGVHIDEPGRWRTADGRNTFPVRYIRYMILKTLWEFYKRIPVSGRNWAPGYTFARN